MRAVFGVVSLLIAVAVVGILGARQLKEMRGAGASAMPQLESGTTPAPALAAASATPREQSQQLQQRVRNDVIKALEQGATRKDESEK